MLTKSQIKYIQSLNQKKFREESGAFVAEGPKILNELLAAHNLQPTAIYATDSWWKANGEIRNEIPFVMFHEISEAELERISFLSTPNQVLAIFKQPVSPEITSIDSIVLLLDSIQDPGNLGTIIRIADWFGISHIVAGLETADVYNPKVVQSTMGSISRVNVSYLDLKTFIAKHHESPVYAASLDGKPLKDMGKIKSGILLIGNESKGISPDLLSLANHKITIQKFGAAESLNVAVATGIILSHVL